MRLFVLLVLLLAWCGVAVQIADAAQKSPPKSAQKFALKSAELPAAMAGAKVQAAPKKVAPARAEKRVTLTKKAAEKERKFEDEQ